MKVTRRWGKGGGEVAAGADAQLPKRRRQVMLDGLAREEQFVADLRVAQALGGELSGAQLGGGQRRDAGAGHGAAHPAAALAFVEAFNDNGWARVASCCAAGVDDDEQGAHRRAHGAEAVVGLAKAWKNAFSDMRGTALRTTADGWTAILEITWTGTHDGPVELLGGTLPPTGNRDGVLDGGVDGPPVAWWGRHRYAVGVESAFVVTVDGNAITHIRNHPDLLTLMAQLDALAGPR